MGPWTEAQWLALSSRQRSPRRRVSTGCETLSPLAPVRHDAPSYRSHWAGSMGRELTMAVGMFTEFVQGERRAPRESPQVIIRKRGPVARPSAVCATPRRPKRFARAARHADRVRRMFAEHQKP